jgi:hypothetical protein
MKTAGAPDGAVHEIRCPSCARLLVLRSGPAITSHYAHRPRQSCRMRPGRAVRPLHLEQLTLFEVEAVPVGDDVLRPLVTVADVVVAPRPVRPRRRRAWLPRLIRWVKSRRH